MGKAADHRPVLCIGSQDLLNVLTEVCVCVYVCVCVCVCIQCVYVCMCVCVCVCVCVCECQNMKMSTEHHKFGCVWISDGKLKMNDDKMSLWPFSLCQR